MKIEMTDNMGTTATLRLNNMLGTDTEKKYSAKSKAMCLNIDIRTYDLHI